MAHSHIDLNYLQLNLELQKIHLILKIILYNFNLSSPRIINSFF